MPKYKAVVRNTSGEDKEIFVEGIDALTVGRLVRAKGLTLIDLEEVEFIDANTTQIDPFSSTRILETDTSQNKPQIEPTLIIDPQFDPALMPREPTPPPRPAPSREVTQYIQTPMPSHPSNQSPPSQSSTKGQFAPQAVYSPTPRTASTVPFTTREVDPDEQDDNSPYASSRHLEIDYHTTPRSKRDLLQNEGFDGVYYTGTITTWDKTAALMLPVATLNDLVFFTRQMAQMLRAGLTVDLALASFLSMSVSPYIKGICNLLHRDVSSGNTLSSAMRKHPRIFSNHFTGMVKIAEIGGRFDETFELMAQYFEKEREFRQRIMNALMQPGCILFFMLLVTGLFSFWPLLEMFSKYFKPVFFGLLIFIGAMIGIMILMSIRHIGGILRVFFSFLPGLGPYLRKVAMSRICFSIANLLKAGVNVLEAVAMTAPSAFLPQYEYELRKIERKLHEGITLHRAMQSSMLFTPVVKNMIAVGEVTGETDVMMMKIHQYYEEDIAYLQRNFGVVIGPVAIVIVGIILLFVLLQFWAGYGNFINNLIEQNFIYFGP